MAGDRSKDGKVQEAPADVVSAVEGGEDSSRAGLA